MKGCDAGRWPTGKIVVALKSLMKSPIGIIFQLVAIATFVIFSKSAWYDAHVWAVKHQYIGKPIECTSTNPIFGDESIAAAICSDESVAAAICILECILAIALLIAALFIRIAYLCIKIVVVSTMEDLRRDLETYDENHI